MSKYCLCLVLTRADQKDMLAGRMPPDTLYSAELMTQAEMLDAGSMNAAVLSLSNSMGRALKAKREPAR